ncbi:phosphoinositide phosphatase SAC7-like protein [Tanacetum coccineum]
MLIIALRYIVTFSLRRADLDGYVANCVESEQIILLKGFTALFVQVRVLCRGEVVISVVVQPGSWFMSGSWWCKGCNRSSTRRNRLLAT